MLHPGHSAQSSSRSKEKQNDKASLWATFGIFWQGGGFDIPAKAPQPCGPALHVMGRRRNAKKSFTCTPLSVFAVRHATARRNHFPITAFLLAASSTMSNSIDTKSILDECASCLLQASGFRIAACIRMQNMRSRPFKP